MEFSNLSVERMIVADETLDHEYLPIEGLKAFTDASARLLLGANSPVILENRVQAV
jgi:aspartate aminotransferase